jgi:tetratricopeptide (TPR) repeat protein
MFGKAKILYTSITLMLLFTLRIVTSAGSCVHQQDTDLSSAIKFFNDGEYEKASARFKKLISGKPEDEMLNYYYGACLVEQDIFTDETIKCLLKAVTGSTPDKVFYYVGKYYQSQEQWNSALKYYNRFRNFGSAADKEVVQIERLIGFCYSKANPQDSGETDLQSVVTKITGADTLASIKQDTLVAVADTVKKDIIVPDETVIAVKNLPPEEEFIPIRFQVNSEIEYLKPEHFRNPEALSFFNEGLTLQQKLERTLSESDSLRGVYRKMETGREVIAERILALERESMTLKNQKDQLFNKARELEQIFWSNANEVETAKFREEIISLKQQLTNKKKEPEPAAEQNVNIQETEIIQQVDPPVVKKEIQSDENKIVYKIQIGSSNRKLPESTARLYKKLSMLRTIEHFKDNRGYTIYTTGNLSNFDDAIKMQGQVRQEGIKDAFIVAYKNGKRIPVNEARGIITKK